MTLTFCRDLSAADWIENSDLPWQRLVGFGPAGFEAYARLRLLPDPARPGQSENDVEAEPWREEQLPRLLEVLAADTATSDDCYFCVWEGYGDDAPADLPRVSVPNRAYWLFRGPLHDVGGWDGARDKPDPVRLGDVEPAFVWPADRRWCVAKDVDPHWLGVGGGRGLVSRLVADRRLDVVAADPTQAQPFYV